MTEPFRYFLRVRYGECDAQHVVYNARYGDYIDLASTEFLRTTFAPRPAFDGTFEFQVAKLLIEWKAPARFDDVLDIAVRVATLGTTSFTLSFEIRVAGKPEVIVTGETVNVHVQGDNGRWTKAAIPEASRHQLTHAALGKIINHAGEFNG
jgi:acyl-CoA thioester hydrolase